jgi:dihydroxyacetone kinase
MPGADHPLFTVPEGQMGLGLGIHGEPGVADEPMPSAAELAATLVDGVLGDRPEAQAQRIAVILNGLGRTKYEELFVVWASVSRLLRERGYVVVGPEVGELVTSLDMAGCSLTVMWLDDELEEYWTAPADTPAYRKGALSGSQQSGDVRTDAAADAAVDAPPLAELSDDEGRAGGEVVARALDAMADMLADAEDELGRIDAVAGDGDHGRGMVKGSAAAREAAARAVSEGAGQGSVLTAAGKEWAAKAGGTSGVLWGAMLNALGARLGDRGRPDSAAVAAGMRDGYDALIKLGGAAPGDKTMLDALLPFVEYLERRVADGERWQEAWRPAADIATEAAHATADLRPRVGRARPLAERSLGTPDAGATSLAMCARTVGDCFTLTAKGDS